MLFKFYIFIIYLYFKLASMIFDEFLYNISDIN